MIGEPVIGERIRAARIAMGMSQEDLAGGTFSRSFISELERNKRRPSAESLQVIAKRLGKPLDYFLNDEHQELHDRANLLINRAYSLLGLNGLNEAETALDELKPVLSQLPVLLRARYHELIAWLEQANNRALSAVNHALIAESLYAELESPERQWYCLHVGAHASYLANLYEQTLELGHRALVVLSNHSEYPKEKRLTLNLLGNACFALGRIKAADDYYSEALLCEAHNDYDTLLRLYQGKSICAEQQGNLPDSLHWAEKASAVSRQKQDIELFAHNEINRGLCLIRLNRLAEAMETLHAHVDKPNVPNDVRAQGCREYLLELSEQDPYPEELCRTLEARLTALHALVKTEDKYYHLKCRWAVAKSGLRRSLPSEIKPVVEEYARAFQSLTHNRRAAEVLEFGAMLLETHGDILGSHQLLKSAVRLK